MSKFVKSTTGYSYFLPDLINVEHTFSTEVYNLCIKASEKLAELKTFSAFTPSVDFFIQMHVSKEAVDSNKIEGTKTEIGDLLVEENLFSTEKRNEIEEVKNYIRALNLGVQRLQELPLSTRLIKEVHKSLMDGVRGKDKNPGEFRISQNWIGGATLFDAHFIPPSHEHIADLMSDLEKFLHYNSAPDLIKIALAHLQFETIHPFLDGNGRVGRLMIILYLLEKDLLHKPVLYISQFFEKNRSLYYQNLDLAKDKANLERWLKFFLVGVWQTAENNLETLQKIVSLKEQTDEKLLRLGRKSKTAKTLVDYLYTNPILTVQEAQKVLNVAKTTANNLVSDLVKIGVLEETTDFKRNRIFTFKNYLDLLTR